MVFQVGDRVRRLKDRQDGEWPYGNAAMPVTLTTDSAIAVGDETYAYWAPHYFELSDVVDLPVALGMALTLADILVAEDHASDDSVTSPDCDEWRGMPWVSIWLREQVRRELLGGA